jgi:hypothetical protein
VNVLVVDTSSWISFLRGNSLAILDLALREGRAYLTSVVAAELLSGFKPESKRNHFISFLRELPLCEASLDHWLRVGDLRYSLARKGYTISTPDAHIVQSTLDLEGYLLTEDKIFSTCSKLTGLKLANSQP